MRGIPDKYVKEIRQLTKYYSVTQILLLKKTICFASFLKINIKTVKDIWTTVENNFKSCNEIYNSLNDERNCISEYARIK